MRGTRFVRREDTAEGVYAYRWRASAAPRIPPDIVVAWATAPGQRFAETCAERPADLRSRFSRLESPPCPPPDRLEGRGAPGHLRLVARHGLRVVRLLPLRHAGAVLRRALLPPGQRHRGAAVGVRHLRRGLPGAAVRRPGLRAPGRPGRPQAHLPADHRGDGRLDLRGRAAADLRDDRHRRADPPGRPAPAPGPGPGRRVRRRGDLRRRARPRRTTRPRHELDPDHRHARLLPVAPGDRHLPLADGAPRRSRAGAGALPFLLSLVLLVFSIYIRLQARRVAGLPRR